VPSRPGRGALTDTDPVRRPPFPDLPYAHALHRNSFVILTHPLFLPRTSDSSLFLRARRSRSLALETVAPCSRHRVSRTLWSSSHRAACTQSASILLTTGSPTRGLSAERLPFRVRDRHARSAPGLDIARRARRGQSICAVYSARPFRAGGSVGPTSKQYPMQSPVVSAENTQPVLAQTYAWRRTVEHTRPRTRTSDARGSSRLHARLVLQPPRRNQPLATFITAHPLRSPLPRVRPAISAR
jgi:hypothetical protein